VPSIHLVQIKLRNQLLYSVFSFMINYNNWYNLNNICNEFVVVMTDLRVSWRSWTPRVTSTSEEHPTSTRWAEVGTAPRSRAAFTGPTSRSRETLSSEAWPFQRSTFSRAPGMWRLPCRPLEWYFSNSFGAQALFLGCLGGPRLPERKPQRYTFHSV
jgi:hypothetical protein